MLDNILKLEGVELLNKQQLKDINGGTGSCQYYDAQRGVRYTNLTLQQAKDRLNHRCDHYCCSSCSTASWMAAPTFGQMLSEKPMPVAFVDLDCIY